MKIKQTKLVTFNIKESSCYAYTNFQLQSRLLPTEENTEKRDIPHPDRK